MPGLGCRLLLGGRLTSRLLGLGLLYRHGLWKDLFWETLEEPCSRALPDLSLLKADLTEPYWMRTVVGGLHPTLGADILLTVFTHDTRRAQHAQLFPAQDATVHTISSYILPHGLQTVHQAPDALLLHGFHLLCPSYHPVDYLLLLVCQFFLLPLPVRLCSRMDGPSCLQLFLVI